MPVDLAEIRAHGEASHQENLAFCRFLHQHHHPIEEFQQIAGEVQRNVDCTACAKCCRETVVAVREPEIEAIAGFLGIEPDLAVRQYTVPDPDNPEARVLRNEHHACVFLDENLCMVYDARPQACRAFPHVAFHCHSLGGRLSSLCLHAEVCPILFQSFEIYKRRTGFIHGEKARR